MSDFLQTKTIMISVLSLTWWIYSNDHTAGPTVSFYFPETSFRYLNIYHRNCIILVIGFPIIGLVKKNKNHRVVFVWDFFFLSTVQVSAKHGSFSCAVLCFTHEVFVAFVWNILNNFHHIIAQLSFTQLETKDVSPSKENKVMAIVIPWFKLRPWSHMSYRDIKGALDNFSLIPNFFSKKLRFLYH